MTTTTRPATPQEWAATASPWFTGGKRDNGDTFRKLKDGAPEWLSDLVREAHGDMMPDDYRYGMIEGAIDAIAEGDEDEEDAAYRFSEGVPHDSNFQRFRWVQSHGSRPWYVDQANEANGGRWPEGGIVEAIRYGWEAEALEVYDLVLAFLESHTEEAGADA